MDNDLVDGRDFYTIQNGKATRLTDSKPLLTVIGVILSTPLVAYLIFVALIGVLSDDVIEIVAQSIFERLITDAAIWLLIVAVILYIAWVVVSRAWSKPSPYPVLFALVWGINLMNAAIAMYVAIKAFVIGTPGFVISQSLKSGVVFFEDTAYLRVGFCIPAIIGFIMLVLKNVFYAKELQRYEDPFFSAKDAKTIHVSKTEIHDFICTGMDGERVCMPKKS
jgi:hypothetical protein